MRWINEYDTQFAIDYKSLWIILSFFILVGALMYAYLEKNNIILGLSINLGFYLVIAFVIFKENKAIKTAKEWIKVEAEALSVQLVIRHCIFLRHAKIYPQITYKYFMDDIKYVSDKMFLAKCGQYYLEGEAKELVKKLVKNDKLSCYINPDNHEQSVVIVDIKKESYFVWFFMTFFMSIVLIITMYS